MPEPTERSGVHEPEGFRPRWTAVIALGVVVIAFAVIGPRTGLPATVVQAGVVLLALPVLGVVFAALESRYGAAAASWIARRVRRPQTHDERE